jgi:sugar lactone lactonase YvrE
MRIRRVTLILFATVGMCVGGPLLLCATASALVFTRQISSVPSGFKVSGAFNEPDAVAVNKFGDLYIADYEHNVVDELSPTGVLLTQIGSTPEEEEIEAPTGLGVDANGDLYIGSAANGLVYEFGPLGVSEYLPPPLNGLEISQLENKKRLGEVQGVAVDTTTGDIYVSDDNSKDESVLRYESSGKYLSQLEGLERPRGIAVDSKGDIYVANSEEKVVDEFAPTATGTATPLLRLTGNDIPAGAVGSGSFGLPVGVAVDSEGNIYVADSSNKVVDEFNASGAYVTQFTGVPAGPGVTVSGGFHRPVGVAVDAAGDLYVADAGGNVVDEFSLLPPAVFVAKPSSVTVTGARLEGSVNPNGSTVASCKFEYGTAAPTEHSVACAEPVVGLGGESPLPVSAAISGLTANTVYYCRLVVESERGHVVSTSTSTGPEARAFVTEAAAPIVSAEAASEVQQFSATLTGAIDPGNAPATYHFAYVEAALYEPAAPNPYARGMVVPVPDLYTPVNDLEDAVVPQAIAGLRPGTTYDFKLVASGPGGTDSTASNETFETLPIPSPLVGTGAAGGVSERAATLSGSIDPQGSSTAYVFQYGTSASYEEATWASWPTIPVTLTLGGLTGQQNVSVYVENLQPSTTYRYRLVAIGPAGAVAGGYGTFTTSSYPASVIQATPMLGTTLGINPETSSSSGKIKHKSGGKKKGKKKKSKRKAAKKQAKRIKK